MNNIYYTSNNENIYPFAFDIDDKRIAIGNPGAYFVENKIDVNLDDYHEKSLMTSQNGSLHADYPYQQDLDIQIKPYNKKILTNIKYISSGDLHISPTSSTQLFYLKGTISETLIDIYPQMNYVWKLEQELEIGYIFSLPIAVTNTITDIERCLRSLKGLQKIHKVGIILGNEYKNYNGYLDPFVYEFYLADKKSDKEHLLHLINENYVEDAEKIMKTDLMRVFRIATCFDILIQLNTLLPEFSKEVDTIIQEYIPNELRSKTIKWPIDIIIEKFLNKYRN